MSAVLDDGSVLSATHRSSASSVPVNVSEIPLSILLSDTETTPDTGTSFSDDHERLGSVRSTRSAASITPDPSPTSRLNRKAAATCGYSAKYVRSALAVVFGALAPLVPRLTVKRPLEKVCVRSLLTPVCCTNLTDIPTRLAKNQSDELPTPNTVLDSGFTSSSANFTPAAPSAPDRTHITCTK